MLALYVQAPFAVCRTFTAGWYRPTAGFLTPSAAYGLILNLAGIESRLREEEPAHGGKVPASLTRPDLPYLRLALGAPAGDADAVFPTVQSVYQQLHNYPVGTSGKEREAAAHGNKYNITPVRRELLVNLRAMIVMDGNAELEQRLQRGLQGDFNDTRYGIPFLGDNSFLLDRMEILESLPPAFWFERVAAPNDIGMRERTTRLTIWIDRADMSRTKSGLFAPTVEPSASVPADAWVEFRPPASTPNTSLNEEASP